MSSRSIGASLALVAISASAVPSPGFARSVGRLLATVPGFFDGVWQVLADLPLLLALLLLVGAILRRRAAIARDLVAVALVAAAGWVVLHRWVLAGWPEVDDAFRAAIPPPEYPSPRIAVAAAVVMAASPHLTKPMRRLGYWVVGLAALAEVAARSDSPPRCGGGPALGRQPPRRSCTSPSGAAAVVRASIWCRPRWPSSAWTLARSPSAMSRWPACSRSRRSIPTTARSW